MTDGFQGELAGVLLFREVIKPSLGPNRSSLLLVDPHSGKVEASSAHTYPFYFSTSTRQNDKVGPKSDMSVESKATKRTEAPIPPERPVAAVTTMVSALLKAQQYMSDSCNDGSISVGLLGASFLEIGFKLHMEGISRNIISNVFQKGLQRSIDILESMPHEKITVNWNSLSEVQYMFQKILESKLTPRESSKLAHMLAISATTVASSLKDKPRNLLASSIIDLIHLHSCVGGDVSMSSQIPGIIFPFTPVSIQAVPSGTQIRVAVFATSLQDKRSKFNVVAKLTSPEILKKWQKEEEQILKDIALRIIAAKATIVISTGPIHKYILHWLDAQEIVAIPSVPKKEAIAISEATGAKLIYQPAVFDSIDLGTASGFEILAISGSRYSLVKAPNVVSLLIRGTTHHKTSQLMQCCRDALAVLREMKITIRDDSELVGEVEAIFGGGVPEMTVSANLPTTANKDSYLEKYVMSAFAGGFDVIPQCLLENAGAPSNSYQHLKAQYERGTANVGITKAGTIQVFQSHPPHSEHHGMSESHSAPLDFVYVKNRIWSTAAEVAALLLVVDDSVAGNHLQ